MEAETYLSNGYGLRIALEERAVGWARLGQLARVWQPLRLKGTLVSPDVGTPFLAATQVFDIRPVPRKWLALERTSNASGRYLTEGTIVVTCSGAVGRATLAHAPHADTLISHDLLRVEAREPEQRGWLYAYLRSPQARAMMSGAQYGHIIKHLEISHLDALPVPVVKDGIAADFQKRTQAILDLRNKAHRLALDAEERFEKALGPLKVKDWGEEGFAIRASALFKTRRRLEATPHNPGVAAIRRHLAKNGSGFSRLRDSSFDVWLPTRFRRVPAEDGVWFLDSGDLFEANPDLTKKIAEADFGDPYKGRVKPGWLLLARSGQTYGINGSVILSSAALEDKVISDHVIRIAPREGANIRTGYLYTALSHPTLGRPLVKSLAYGSSIPEIDPSDFAEMEIVRLSIREEAAIADLAEASAAERARADVLERALAEDAGKLLERFLAGDMLPFVTTMPAVITNRPSGHPGALPEHARVRLLHDVPKAGVRAGETGAIVHVYGDGEGYEVEFIKGRERPVVLTVEAADVEAAEE